MVDQRRLYRAQNQDISIQRSLGKSRYVVSGARGYKYTVNLSQPDCTCPDWQKRQPTGGCKHILRVKLEQGLIEPLDRPYTNFGDPSRRTSGSYSNWDELSKRTKKRDCWACQRCGAEGGHLGSATLVAHHIVPKSRGGEDRLDNLITLCHECHEVEHGHTIPRGHPYKSDTATAVNQTGPGETDLGSEPSKTTDSNRVSTMNSWEISQSDVNGNNSHGSNSAGSKNRSSSESESVPIDHLNPPSQIKTEDYNIYVSVGSDIFAALFGAVIFAILAYFFVPQHLRLIALGGAVLVFLGMRKHSIRVKRDMEALESHHEELSEKLVDLQKNSKRNRSNGKSIHDRVVSMKSLVDSTEPVVNEEYARWISKIEQALRKHR